MVKLRLKRFGRRNRPYYRLAAMDARTKRDGRTIEELGTFDPVHKDADKRVTLNTERIQYWLSVGAQPSETVTAMLRKNGIEVKESKQSKNRKKKAAAASA
jgi:small subunit ribosomal protein S16